MSKSGRTAKSPAFQFYPGDFLSDGPVAGMTALERGIYIGLLSHAWLEGSLPNEPAFLARIARVTLDEFNAAWWMVGRCFIERGDGRLVNPRQERERQSQEDYREEMRTKTEKARAAAQAAQTSGGAVTDRSQLCDSLVTEIPQDCDSPLPIPSSVSASGSVSPERSTSLPRRAGRGGPAPLFGRDSPREKPDKPGTPQAELVDWFAQAWAFYRKDPKTGIAIAYLPAPRKEYVAAAKLLGPYVRHEIEERAKNMLELDDPFHWRKASLCHLLGNWLQFGMRPVEHNGRAV